MEPIRFPEELEKQRTKDLASYYDAIMQCVSCGKQYGMDDPINEESKKTRKGICPRCDLRGNVHKKGNNLSVGFKSRNRGIQHGV